MIPVKPLPEFFNAIKTCLFSRYPKRYLSLRILDKLQHNQFFLSPGHKGTDKAKAKTLLEIHIAYLKISNYRKWAAIQILQFNRWSAEYLGAVRCENMLRNFYFCEIMLKINWVKKVNNICAHQNLITDENSFLKQMQPNLPQIYSNSLTRIWISYLVRLYSGNNFQPFPKWFWNALVVAVKPHSASDGYL